MKAAMVAPQPLPSGEITVLGTVAAISVTLVSPRASKVEALMALMASGVFCSLVSRNWAVTTTSPTPALSVAGASAAKAALPKPREAIAALPTKSAFRRPESNTRERMTSSPDASPGTGRGPIGTPDLRRPRAVRESLAARTSRRAPEPL